MFRLILTLLVGLLCALGHAQAQPPLQIGVQAVTSESRFAMSVLTYAYRQVGRGVEFHPLPGERSLFESNLGNLDGEAGRNRAIESRYPNLIRIDVPLLTVRQSAVSLRGRGPVDANNLLNKRILIRRGYKADEDRLRGNKSTTAVDTYRQALLMLNADRADVVIGYESAIREEIRRQGFKEKDFDYLPLYSSTVYHYIHKKHTHLAPRIQSTLHRIRGNSATVVDGARRANIRWPVPMPHE